jgi:hypothetical protein
MRTISTVTMAALALVLAGSLTSIANARALDNDELGRSTTIYAQPDPALVQMEQRTYQADLNRQQTGQAATSSQPSVAAAPK